jgi:hypothetical protein
MQTGLKSTAVEQSFAPKSVAACVVRRVSHFGAHLEVSSSINVPETFNMTFDGGYSVRPCRLLWRLADKMAIEFL